MEQHICSMDEANICSLLQVLNLALRIGARQLSAIAIGPETEARCSGGMYVLLLLASF